MIDYIDLSGEWKVCLDKDRLGMPADFPDRICLPDTTSHAGLGEENTKREDGFLTDTRLFEGDAWFMREADLSKAVGKNAVLILERTRLTKVFIDGEEVGSQDSLNAPHIYDIGNYIRGGVQKILICVSNVGYPTKGGHLTSQDTQTNWNGITGKIGVQILGQTYVSELRVDPVLSEKSFRICAKITGETSGKATVSAVSFNAPEGKAVHAPKPVEAVFSGGELLVTLPLGADARTWDEYSPELYKISVRIADDVTETTAGLREFKTVGDKFCINGRVTFLRGKHDGMIFPKTGFAPTDVDEWLRVFRISKSYGMNHYRFHTCCPPEAAFEAADLAGVYLEPQLPFWGTIHARNEEGFDEIEQSYLISEGFRMLNEFGNHPSFCMMSMGNELWGSPERINDILAMYKHADNRHLYTQGSNNFQWYPNVVENDDFFVGVRLASDRLLRGSYAMCDAPLGHIQTDKPSTTHNYDSVIRPVHSAVSTEASEDGTVQIQYGTTMKTVKATEANADFIPEVPIVTHEIGQFETYPNFSEIEKYTGSIKAYNFEIFRDRLEKAGLLPLARDYFEASGALAVQCYKEEMESVFRSKLLGGFQLLDIQDFSGQGTALVGVLDAFMDEKGTCSPEQWREFCNDCVILAEFGGYCLEAGSDFRAVIRLTNFRPTGITGRNFSAKLICGCGNVKAELTGVIPDTKDNYLTLGELTAVIPSPKVPKRFRLELEVEGTDVRNHYELMVYPKQQPSLPEGTVFASAEDAKDALAQGKTVLILPDLDKLENSIEGFWCQDFWCYPMFRTISNMMNKPEPVGTMGLLIDTEHPSLAAFPCRKYSEPLWWDIVMNSRSEILDGHSEGKRVIIRSIDNVERNHDLALMYEYEVDGGTAVVLNARADKLKDSPEGRQFLYSVGEYIRSRNA